MKSPAELSQRFRRQWDLADNREQRLLHEDVWPMSLSIGKPTAEQFTRQTAEVRAHLQRWRAVSVGEIVWQTVAFRGGTDPVKLPTAWRVRNADEWVKATADPAIDREHATLKRLLAVADPLFRSVLVRQRSLLEGNSEEEILQCAALAMTLSVGCAEGRPLRALSGPGIDSKFIERHRALLIALLDARFEGQVSDVGLEAFLGALDINDHWLLVVALDPDLPVPFEQLRVRACELQRTALPGTDVLIVENESSLHQLGTLKDTVAVLGAGLNLEWLQGNWLKRRHIGYWGDLDSWGLLMLARARSHQTHVVPLLMTRAVFDAYAGDSAVPEPVAAGAAVPECLTSDEQALFAYLRNEPRGRLEQEFIPTNAVRDALRVWRSSR
jgi:hypothetical protein